MLAPSRNTAPRWGAADSALRARRSAGASFWGFTPDYTIPGVTLRSPRAGTLRPAGALAVGLIMYENRPRMRPIGSIVVVKSQYAPSAHRSIRASYAAGINYDASKKNCQTGMTSISTRFSMICSCSFFVRMIRRRISENC